MAPKKKKADDKPAKKTPHGSAAKGSRRATKPARKLPKSTRKRPGKTRPAPDATTSSHAS